MVNYSDLTPEEVADFDERAAIMEFDGGMTREEAEQCAMDIIVKQREHKDE